MEPLENVAKILLGIVKTSCESEHQAKVTMLADITWAAVSQGISPESVLVDGRRSAMTYLLSMQTLHDLRDDTQTPASSDRSLNIENALAWSRVRSQVLKSLLKR